MATFGGTNAGVLKKGLDSVFETGNIPIDDYQTELVSATADGANVNLDIYGGSLTMMTEQRPWLVTIHSVNHCLEVAIKDSYSDINTFQDCDQFCLTLFFSFKTSVKLKTSIKNTTEAIILPIIPYPKSMEQDL